MQAADTIVLLDLPRWVCLFQVLKRIAQYRNERRSDMAIGCNERLDLSFLKFVWEFPAKQRPTIKEKLSKLPADKKIIVLRSRKEAEAFLEGIHIASQRILAKISWLTPETGGKKKLPRDSYSTAAFFECSPSNEGWSLVLKPVSWIDDHTSICEFSFLFPVQAPRSLVYIGNKFVLYESSVVAYGEIIEIQCL
ncbi:hypothetical protein FHS18_002140 [Paenibacillus phyllosphaerae]|uniref:Uncharacterized protein n=1 Tax=Paenibacillus phyllosphaerae TaxID=274593 RepID=A0A7W5AWF4_9BACL|nr:hypothetical protein [Paenibacillus phyllosphaerae]